MTYTPQPGDRVTSPLLVGEWEVTTVYQGTAARLKQGTHVLTATSSDLTPVTPPLPPEPAVGSVVRAYGRLWHKKADYWRTSLGDVPKKWPALAAAPDLSPVVAVDDVAGWLAGTEMDDDFCAEFGGWGKDQTRKEPNNDND